MELRCKNLWLLNLFRKTWFKANMVYTDLFQVMMRNLSFAMSATRLSTCSACDRPSTGSPLESGCARPASPLWPGVAPA